MCAVPPSIIARHIGNARPAVVFDTLARLIRHVHGAQSLTYARNVTDVDDKIIDAARDEGVDPAAITERFERTLSGRHRRAGRAAARTWRRARPSMSLR
jgi:cysteinyl-tRNA synthetase